MYAVMRFGKTVTALKCAQEMNAAFVVVVSGKADVMREWKNTVLSFNSVTPQVEYHYTYSLLGDGCYSMDKAPNIVINRCRVKGMSQQVCASKVRWITRAM